MKINNRIKKEDLNNLKELLIIIDMVNGFVKEGMLASPSIQRIIPRILELLDENEKNPNSINMFIRDTHDMNSSEFKTYAPHCVKGTKEVLVIDEFKQYQINGIDFEKNSTNFVLAPGVIELFNNLPNLEKIKLVGCLSEVCVKNGAITAKNYFDQVNRNIEVEVYEDAIDTYSIEGHIAEEVTKKSLEDMKANGIKILRKEVQ